MSGTSRAAVGDAGIFLLEGADYIGASGFFQIPFNQWTNGAGGWPDMYEPFPFPTAVGARTNTNPAAVVQVDTARAAVDEARGTTIALDWFEKVHILPRTKIEFGNIITLTEQGFEIYNAFRDTDLTLAAVVNNALPGINLPEVIPPITVEAQSSHLSASSTGNSAGTGLGTLVLTKIQALQDGLPSFDTSVVFDFSAPGNDVQLLISGQRIVLMPMAYEAPVKETLAWLTDIIESLDGREQRIALRQHPRAIFEVTYLLDDNERQRMEAILFDWMDNLFGFPLWHERVFLTAATSVGATVYQVRGADVVDFRVGGMAVVIQDSGVYDVITIQAVTATQITATSASVNGYAMGTAIMPLRIARIKRAVVGARTHVKLGQFTITFEVSDNTTGAVAGSTTPGFWTIYNSRVLFSDNNYIQGTMREEFLRRVHRIDNDTGTVSQTSYWDRNKRGHEKGFVLRSRADIYTFRKLLTSLRGRQKAVWIPTFIEDLTVVATLSSGTSTMDVQAHEYVRYINNRLSKKIFRITFTDGTTLVRSVQSSATISSTVERLTLDTTWPSTKTVAQVSRVEYYELVRFDADEITINYPRIGQAYCNVPLMRVFDDN